MKQIVIYVIIYVVTQWSEQYKLDQPSNPVLDLSDESSDQWILMSTSSWATGNGSKMTIDIQCYSLWILIEFDYISRAWIVIWGTPHISFVVHNVPLMTFNLPGLTLDFVTEVKGFNFDKKFKLI